jgi:hypothetical protein
VFLQYEGDTGGKETWLSLVRQVGRVFGAEDANDGIMGPENGDGKVKDIFQFDDAAEAKICANKKTWTDKLINNMKCITPYHQGWSTDDRVYPGFLVWVIIVGTIVILLLLICIIAIILVSVKGGMIKSLQSRVKDKKSENKKLLGDVQLMEESVVAANEKHERLLKIVDAKREKAQLKKQEMSNIAPNIKLKNLKTGFTRTFTGSPVSLQSKQNNGFGMHDPTSSSSRPVSALRKADSSSASDANSVNDNHSELSN